MRPHFLHILCGEAHAKVSSPVRNKRNNNAFIHHPRSARTRLSSDTGEYRNAFPECVDETLIRKRTQAHAFISHQPCLIIEGGVPLFFRLSRFSKGSDLLILTTSFSIATLEIEIIHNDLYFMRLFSASSRE